MSFNDDLLDAITPAQARADWKQFERGDAPKDRTPRPRERAPSGPRDGSVGAQRVPFQPDHLDLGELVVGGHYARSLTPVINFDPSGGSMVITTMLVGDKFALKTEATRTVRSMNNPSESGSATAPIELTFSPDAPGAYSATLFIGCEWPDGATYERKVTIAARARRSNEKVGSHPAVAGERSVDAVSTAGGIERKLAYPSSYDLGDRVVGTRNETPIFVFNTTDIAATTTVALEGPACLRVDAAPRRLVSHMGFDPTSAIALMYLPEQPGRLRGKVTLDAAFEDGSGTARAEIAITGAAHDGSDGSYAEHEAKHRDELARTERAQQEQREHDHLQQQIDADLQSPKQHHAGHQRELEQERDGMIAAYLDVLMHRKDGVNQASTAIGKFERDTPEGLSLVSSFAWLALDIASAGIANALGKVVEVAYKDFTKESPVVMAFLTGVTKDSTQKAEKAGIAGGHGKSPVGDKGESLVKREFIDSQQEAITSRWSHEKAHEVGTFLFNTLMLHIDAEPAQSIATMRTMKEQMMVQVMNSADIQQRETELQWVRLVGATSTKGERLAVAPTDEAEETPLKRFDGVIDLTFAPGAEPADPVALASATIRGVSSGVVARIRAKPILDAGIPIRATATPAPQEAITKLAVSLDEHGELDYVDETHGKTGSHWFAQHAGVLHGGGKEAQIAGARQVLEELAPEVGHTLKTDSKT